MADEGSEHIVVSFNGCPHVAILGTKSGHFYYASPDGLKECILGDDYKKKYIFDGSKKLIIDSDLNSVRIWVFFDMPVEFGLLDNTTQFQYPSTLGEDSMTKFCFYETNIANKVVFANSSYIDEFGGALSVEVIGETSKTTGGWKSGKSVSDFVTALERNLPPAAFQAAVRKKDGQVVNIVGINKDSDATIYPKSLYNDYLDEILAKLNAGGSILCGRDGKYLKLTANNGQFSLDGHALALHDQTWQIEGGQGVLYNDETELGWAKQYLCVVINWGVAHLLTDGQTTVDQVIDQIYKSSPNFWAKFVHDSLNGSYGFPYDEWGGYIVEQSPIQGVTQINIAAL
jgi:Beta-1,3-glucanase